jgi:8-oxo-dGTP pyrophosphatase MutT (NUDIX family)
MTLPSQKTLIIVSGALFSGEGKLLMLQRADADIWELPGGKLDFGESPELGLVRCFSETTDMDVAPDRPLGAWSVLEMQNSIENCYVHIDYTVKNSAAMVGVQLDVGRHRTFAWLSRAEATAKIPVPAMRASIERAFNALARSRKNS